MRTDGCKYDQNRKKRIGRESKRKMKRIMKWKERRRRRRRRGRINKKKERNGQKKEKKGK